MKDQVLKLCRRLKQCTLSDITEFLDLTQEQVMPILYYLIDNKYLKEKNGIYSLLDNNLNTKAKNLLWMAQHHSHEDFEIILKGFCLEIAPHVLQHFVKCKDKCICDFYQQFREKIYETQYKKLLSYYLVKPQITRPRVLFNKYVYFYMYDNNVYVSDKPLKANGEKPFSKKEILEFKNVYLYLRRLESHNMNKYYLYHRLAEGIWRKNKQFEQMYFELKSFLCL